MLDTEVGPLATMSPGAGLSVVHPRRERIFVVLLLAGSALVFLWNLDVSGYANAYYAAAAQAGAESWKAMFFGSLDPASAITVDKPPLALWPLALSVRGFGLSPWSILVPQALEGVASVALLHACVRRATGAAAPALLAGLAFTLTPVAALVFRYDNPDALLVLLLVGAAYATLRAIEGRRATWWLVLAGALCGLGFLTKMLEAFVVLPAMALTFLVHGRGPVRARLLRLCAAGLALVTAAGWWVAIVELTPAVDRPFVGGSPTDSVLELALGYNGMARLTGSTASTTGGGFASTNLARIGRTDLGGEVMWLVPAALVLAGLAWWVARRDPALARIRPSLLLWSTWLVLGATTFAAMTGIFHAYYTVLLAPAIAALVGTGCWVAWERRDAPGVRRCMSWATGATAALAAGTLLVLGFEVRWVSVPVLALGLVAATLLHPRVGLRELTPFAATLALVAALAGPAVFVGETVRLPHVGSGPLAGPGHGASSTELLAGAASPGVGSSGYRPVTPGVTRELADRPGDFTWSAAAMGARSAAAYQLATGAPVLAIGGYKGTDPYPTLAAFEAMVAAGKIHWLVPGGTSGIAARAIQEWVASRFDSVVVDGQVLYDLSHRLGRP